MVYSFSAGTSSEPRSREERRRRKGSPFPFGGGRALGVKCSECAAEAYSMAAWAAERRAMGTRKGEQLT